MLAAARDPRPSFHFPPPSPSVSLVSFVRWGSPFFCSLALPLVRFQRDFSAPAVAELSRRRDAGMQVTEFTAINFDLGALKVPPASDARWKRDAATNYWHRA
jgi:hypothetical protein